MSLPVVGIVGIGNMGLAVALRLRERGLDVAVHDIDPARPPLALAAGASVADSAAALGAGCACVIVAVVDAAQCDAVLWGPQGLAAGMNDGGCVLLCPTIAPADTERIAARLAAHGIDCLDAPMSGGPARARDGTMSLMLAGDAAVIERHRAVLDALSSRQFLLGPRIGDGARTKLVNNLLAALNLAGAAEALALAERVGLDAARTLDVIEHSSGQSWIGSERLRRAIAGDLAPRAHTALLTKDSRLALEMAAAAGLAPGLGSAAAAVFGQACADGLATQDDASLLAWMRAQLAAGAGSAGG